MDVLLGRLEELGGGGEGGKLREDELAEARMLWRTLEVLVASLNPREMRVGEKSFSKLLDCARQVVDYPDRWTLAVSAAPAGQTSSEDRAGVFVFAVRVVAKIAARGNREREALVAGGILSAIKRALLTHLRQDAYVVAAILSVFWAIATDATVPHDPEVSGLVLDVMETHHRDLGVQISGIKLLQIFAKDPRCTRHFTISRGLPTVLDSMRSHSDDLAVAMSGLDIIEAIWETTVHSSSEDASREALLEDIIVTSTTIMTSHAKIDRVISSGLRLLQSIVYNFPSARVSLASTSVWELAGLALDAPSDDTARTFADLLTDVLGDLVCIEALKQGRKSARLSLGRLRSRRQILEDKLMAASPSRLKPNDLRAEAVVRALMSAVNESDATLPIASTEDISTPLPYVTSCTEGDISAPAQPMCRKLSSEETSSDVCRDTFRESSDRTASNETLVSPSCSPKFYGVLDDTLSERESALSDPAPYDLVSRSPQSPGQIDICNEMHDDSGTISRMDFPSIKRIDERLFSKKELQRRIVNDASASMQWKDQYESVSTDYSILLESYHALEEKLHVALRRAEEQSNLLSIQANRLKHQSQVHQQVLYRMRTLEGELFAVKKQYQVEHELRVAEATQSEKISLTLHEATQEIKLLNSQKISTSRELFEKDRQRIDYQSRASEIKQMKQKLELERDEAFVAMQVMRQEKLELVARLEECRREGIEALAMREEDSDAVKPRVFSEVLRLASPRTGMLTSTIDGIGNYRSVRTEERMNNGTLSVGNSVFHGVNSLEILAGSDLSTPTIVDRDEIERCLRDVFESLGASSDGNGVHIATVRRFFLDSGLAQPPAVSSADVDVILAKVLASTSETMKKTIARKDYGFTQVTPPPRLDVRKYRFFDQDSFNEAVTIVGMKRFPRFDLFRALQNVVTLYLIPYRRQYRSRSNSAAIGAQPSTKSAWTASGPAFHRPMSMYVGSPNLTGSGITPITACGSIMRAILTGLALHIGRGNDHQQLSYDGDTSEIRFHSTSSSSSNNNNNCNNNNRNCGENCGPGAKKKREDIVYSMLEMHEILSREQKPIVALVEFYGSVHHTSPANELFGLGFDLVLNFAMDFEIIPSFMDRKKIPFVADTETLKKAAFMLVLARLAMELFSAKIDFETPERQITALLQWIDNSVGREKIMRKASLPVVIKFSRKLYTPNA